MKPYPHLIAKTIAILIISTFVLSSRAQTFVPDKQGYVTGEAFQQFVKKQGYQLVGSFDTAFTRTVVANVMKNNKWLQIDTHGKETDTRISPGISPPGDIAIGIGEADNAALKDYDIVNINGKYGTKIKKTQQDGLPPVYDGISAIHGIFETRMGNKYGLARGDGKVLKAPQYDRIQPLIFDYRRQNLVYLLVRKDVKYGLLTVDGQDIIPADYDQISSCGGCDVSGNLLSVTRDKKMGIISNTGKVIVEPKYDRINPLTFRGQMTYTEGSGADLRYGLLDSAGKVLLKPDYTKITYVRSANVLIIYDMDNGQTITGLANLTGKIILPPAKRGISETFNGPLSIREGGKAGIFFRGKLIPADTYEGIEATFDKAYLLVKKDGVYGTLDAQGQLIIKPEFDLLLESAGRFAARKDQQWKLLDARGRLYKTLSYERVTAAGNYLTVSKDGKLGVIDFAGNIVIPIKYDKFKYPDRVMNKGMTIATLNGQEYLVDRYGHEVLNTFNF